MDRRPGRLIGRRPFEQLTAQELLRLAWWADAYRAEAGFGAEDGKRWVFARYLIDTRRLNEDRC